MAILFQGGIIKKISLLMIALIISACGGKPSEPEAAAAVTAEEIEVVVEAAQETSSPPAMVEFVWHSKAEGFSDDALWSHTEYWANVATEAGWDLRLSAIHTPRVENENFDFLWVMVWPTV